jgi:serine/threonine-protein kinase
VTDSAFDELFVAFQRAVIGRYSLDRELGRGGMGVVYLAREVRLDRPVAIKLIPPELAERPELRDRFMREARTAARLSHPYIVPIHAVEEIGGFVFIVMAYVDGGTLAQRVAAHGPLPAHEASRIMREVAWALAYAHAQGVIHRDIKPANILLEHGTGRAMVTDFGIARLTESDGDTASGMVLGTPEFMSPEQAAAEPLDGRSDLYALGIVAYFALTGTLPFTATSAQAVLAQQLTKTPLSVAVAARGAPRALAEVIDRCLEKDPAARFINGEALAAALETRREAGEDIPVPVRVFLDRRRMMMLVIPVSVTFSVGAGIVTSMAQHGARSWAPVFGAGVLALAVGFPLAMVTYRLRRLLRLGYGRDDITAALQKSFMRAREEFHYEFGVEPTTREKLFRTVAIAGILGGVVLPLALGATGVMGANALAPVSFGALYVGVIAAMFSTKWRRLREGKQSLWSRFWSGKLGANLVRFASINLGNRAVPADRPTELAIAMSAEAMFGTLPRAMRDSLGDVPAVLREIEGHARAARARVEELDAAIAEAQHGRGANRSGSAERQESLLADLSERRNAAEARLAELVTALENVRLDLLRLRAGGGSVDGITRDIAAARAFGEEADRLLASGREVDDALRKPAGR